MNKHTVNHIRTLYVSGLYHKADLVLRFLSELENPLEIQTILDYNCSPEVRPELRLPIYGIAFIQELSEEYHKTLRVAAELDGQVEGIEEFSQAKKKALCKMEDKLSIVNDEFNLSFSSYDIQSRICKFF